MPSADVSLRSMRTSAQLLATTPSGGDAQALAEHLGLWTTPAHRQPEPRRAFRRNLGEASPIELVDEMGHWTAEFGRIVELSGLLTGQRDLLRISLKSEKARARVRLRTRYLNAEDTKMPTATALNDEAEDQEEVVAVEQELAKVELALTQVMATKEATAQYLATVSRAQSMLEAQIKGRMY